MTTRNKNHSPSAQDFEQLESAVKKLTRRLEYNNSVRHTFFLSIIRGVGTVLGATLVAGLVIAFMLRTVRSLDSLPVIDTLLDAEKVEQKLEGYSRP